MKRKYHIDPESNLILKKHTGPLSVDDEINIINDIITDPKYRKGLNALCDLSEASVIWSLEDLDRFRAFVSRIKRVTGKHKWAILVSRTEDTATARMFAALHGAMEDTIEVRLFFERDEAFHWLQTPVLKR